MRPWKIGDHVRAQGHITDTGAPDDTWVHAERGDTGTVEYVDGEGYATVRFDRTGSATVVGHHEIKRVN